MKILVWRVCLSTYSEKWYLHLHLCCFRPRGKVMFSEVSVSHSVHRRSLSPLWTETLHLPPAKQRSPSGQRLPSGQRPLLWTEIPPPDRDPLWTETALELISGGNQCSGRYTSYWNSFLFFYKYCNNALIYLMSQQYECLPHVSHRAILE